MKPTTIVILTVVVALSGSFLFTWIFTSLSADGTESAAHLQVQVDSLSRQVDALTAANRDLEKSVATLRLALEGGEAGTAREPLVSVAVEVDRWIRENRPDLLEGGPGALPSDTASGIPGAERQARAAQMLALLDDPALTPEEWTAAWQKISDAGLMEDAIALLESAVETDPSNPEAHMALAGGYLARTTLTANDLEKGIYAVAADRSLDRVLELNPGHWDARFTKASSLTFYPPIMGKQGEALKHFEILLEQQKTLPRDPSHSQTFLFLGNLHQQMGNYGKASRVWNDGLAQFPDNAELAKQLENALKN